MKQKNVKKLTLNKITIQDLQVNLSQDELKMINGGSATTTPGTTEPPVYCR
ncbi:MAG TPA: hypothetical protein VK186_22345 [Candidatus Deferrimicrobium sp.]|nr:hypothetical protein [Candidatus Kapabacteria bacterium]HLP61598.1 hypothetical protein [Candidatus Deferrimicrobium sp.]